MLLTEITTAMINASTTAYSTLVGPSSFLRKAIATRANRPIIALLPEFAGKRAGGLPPRRGIVPNRLRPSDSCGFVGRPWPDRGCDNLKRRPGELLSRAAGLTLDSRPNRRLHRRMSQIGRWWNSTNGDGKSGIAGSFARADRAENDSDAAKVVDAFDQIREALEGRGRAVEQRGILDKSQHPDDRTAKDAGAIEQAHEFSRQPEGGIGRAIGFDSGGELRIVVADKIAEHSGQVHGRVVDLHRAVIDDARDLVARVENVLAMDIAETWMQGNRSRLPRSERPFRGFDETIDRFACSMH